MGTLEIPSTLTNVASPRAAPMPPFHTDSLVTAAAIPAMDWSRLTPNTHPFLDEAFFTTLERHEAAGPACGWHPRHLVARGADGDILGLAPSYVKTNSHGDFVRDWSWASAYQQLGKIYYPKLLTAVPHTPVSGTRLFVAAGEDPDAVSQCLIDAGKTLVKDNNFSSWHIALPAPSEVERFRASGFLVSHDVQFHWHDRDYGDFEGYLAHFASARRRKLRAERRKVEESGLHIVVRHGDEIDTGEWSDLHALYAATFDKFGNYAAFSPACFAELATRLGRLMVLFVAYAAGQPVAVSICFRNDKTLYGRYWGTTHTYHSLHFELCFYQGIAYCLREGLKTFEPGAGGEHKVARGFEPTIVRSCHWIVDERMHHLIGQYLERHRISVEAYAEEAASHLPFRQE